MFICLWLDQMCLCLCYQHKHRHPPPLRARASQTCFLRNAAAARLRNDRNINKVEIGLEGNRQGKEVCTRRQIKFSFWDFKEIGVEDFFYVAIQLPVLTILTGKMPESYHNPFIYSFILSLVVTEVLSCWARRRLLTTDNR